MQIVLFLVVHPCDKAKSPCKNEGVCEKNGDEFVCKCSEDWTGDTCEVKGITDIFITINQRLENSLQLGNYTFIIPQQR